MFGVCNKKLHSLAAMPIRPCIGIVFHRNPWSIADKVLTEELSSAIPELPIICTLASLFNVAPVIRRTGVAR